MGEIAEQILDGEICQFCQCAIIPPAGYPTSCDECGSDDVPRSQKKRKKRRGKRQPADTNAK